MRDYQLRILGVVMMVLSCYGLSTVVREILELTFYFEQLHPLTGIFGMMCMFAFALGFVMIILNYSVIREPYYQKRLEDFNQNAD